MILLGDVRFRGGAVVIKDTNDIEFGGGDSTAAGYSGRFKREPICVEGLLQVTG